MGLLHLPKEMFDLIVQYLAASVSFEEASRLRLICRTINHCILKEKLRQLSKESFEILFNAPSGRALFEAHAGTIIALKIINLHDQENSAITFIQTRLLSHLQSPEITDDDRREDTYNVCNALMAMPKKQLYPYLTGRSAVTTDLEGDGVRTKMLFIAAATGNKEMLQKFCANHMELIAKSHDLVPTALAAAVATGQNEMLSFILQTLGEKVKGKPDVKTWDEMRKAGRSIGAALAVAARLHKNEAGNIIFSFLCHHPKIRGSLGLWACDNVIKECFRYSNEALILGALQLERHGYYDPAEPDKHERGHLGRDYALFLLKHGRPGALRAVLDLKLLDPNPREGNSFPLQYALIYYRQDLARVLLENGADIDAPSRDVKNETALYYAAGQGFSHDVKFLLEHGATPVHPDPFKSPLHAARDHYKCRGILREAIKRWEAGEKNGIKLD